MWDVTLGAGLIIIALTAQYLLSRRAKNAKMGKFLSWVAWVCAVVGGTTVTVDVQDLVGVTSAGAAVASVIMLFFIAVDVADRRPDWLAFILICIAPTFMRLSGGGIGQIFDAVLWAPAQVGAQLSTFLGI
jgi:vacuolar-type H+-ATPase subunit I/STV1